MFRNVQEHTVLCLVILDWFMNRILCNHTEHSRPKMGKVYNRVQTECKNPYLCFVAVHTHMAYIRGLALARKSIYRRSSRDAILWNGAI